MRRASYCHACRREVLWSVTDAGKRLALDPEPDANGNTAAYRDGDGVYRSRRPTVELPTTGWEKTYVPHVATCTGRVRATPAAPAELPPGVLDMAAYRLKLRGPSPAPARRPTGTPAAAAAAAGDSGTGTVGGKPRRRPARAKKAAPGQGGLW